MVILPLDFVKQSAD